MAPPVIDALTVAQDLIRCASVTPADDGALDRVGAAAEALGFTVERLAFQSPDAPRIDNLIAIRPPADPDAPILAFAGHTDVVPPGPTERWTHDPFAASVVDGRLYGRGACDMKGAIAAFLAAVSEVGPTRCGLMLLITGDEEADAIDGTVRLVETLAERGTRIDACIVGEPTSTTALGDTVKIGRRGSMTGFLTAHGQQGHTAYPHQADNAAETMVRLLAALKAEPIDDGSDHFPATTLAIATVDVGNPANNVIPGEARAAFNIRFNDRHDSAAVAKWVVDRLDKAGGAYTLTWKVSGESFLTPPGPLSDTVTAAVEAVTGRTPALSTTGGTSDARFIRRLCPVVELGLVNETIHRVDENTAVADLKTLTAVYAEIIRRIDRDGLAAPDAGSTRQA